MNIAVQALGILAFCVAFMSFQQKQQKWISFLQFVSSALLIYHYYALGATIGFLFNIVGAVRGLIFSQRDKHAWARHIIWPIAMILIFIIITVRYATSLLDILPVIGMTFSTLALRTEKAKNVRILSLCSVPFWLIYNAASGSIGATLIEIFNAVSIISAMIRLDRKKTVSGENAVK